MQYNEGDIVKIPMSVLTAMWGGEGGYHFTCPYATVIQNYDSDAVYSRFNNRMRVKLDVMSIHSGIMYEGYRCGISPIGSELIEAAPYVRGGGSNE